MTLHPLRAAPVAIIALAAMVLGGAIEVAAQESAPADAEATNTAALEQALVDLDALVIATQVTTRCALYDPGTAYLSPLNDTAARLRIAELEALLAPLVTDLPDQMATMREEANAIACGNAGLAPFLDFARQIGNDVSGIALRAWGSIDIDPCAYFADNGFLAAAARAREVAATIDDDPDPNREAYLDQAAQVWITLFDRNCYNPAFDPITTLPGQIALALPSDG